MKTAKTSQSKIPEEEKKQLHRAELNILFHFSLQTFADSEAAWVQETKKLGTWAELLAVAWVWGVKNFS